jgi:hypothetical protein
MWDDKRKVGVLNDFDLAGFADRIGTSWQDNTGTLPFMALDLLSGKGLHGGIPRLYRHEAESFAWSLIYLHLATVEDKNRKNHTWTTNALLRWFGSREISHDARKALAWRAHNNRKVSLAYPNTRKLARYLHRYWVNRYDSQLLHAENEAAQAAVVRSVTSMQASTGQSTAYKELEDEEVFQQLVGENMVALWELEAGKMVYAMNEKYKKIDWNA